MTAPPFGGAVFFVLFCVVGYMCYKCYGYYMFSTRYL